MTTSVQALVVDDDITIRYALVLQLDNFGIKADSAANGLEALRRVKDWRYAIIFMDMSMPHMDGYEAAAAIRAYERNQGQTPVPIIGHTGDSESSKERCLDAGMNDFVSKPMTPEILRQVIVKWMDGWTENPD